MKTNRGKETIPGVRADEERAIRPRRRIVHCLWAIACLLFFSLLNTQVSYSQSSEIHVYESGTSPYIGATGLKQALADVAEAGTVYVHSGTYDLGATDTSFLTISKGLILAGVDEGGGKPEIKGGKPSGSPGILLVDAPGKTVVLDNLKFSFYGTRPFGSTDYAVRVQGSSSFTLRNCDLAVAYFDGANNTGMTTAISVHGPTQSEFPTNPNYPLRYSVKGEIKIQKSTLTSWINPLGIGFNGPVSLDKVEISDSTITALGATQLGNWARGNFGIFFTQYPAYMNDSNRGSLIEATRAETEIIIKNNTIRSVNCVWLLYLKGIQRLEQNRIYSFGSWYSVGKYYQAGITASGYPHDVSDPTTYSEAIIKNNVIELRVPPFPIAPSIPFAPPQTLSNTSPPKAIWLGLGGRVFYNSTITGHFAKATVTGNIVSSSAFSPSDPINHPDYGIYLTGKMKDSFISGNNLAGGMLRDPVDGEIIKFNPFSAKIAQVFLGQETHDNYVGSEAGNGLPGNLFGPADIAGVICFGRNNQFIGNHFLGNYAGWEPGEDPGLFWLSGKGWRSVSLPSEGPGTGPGLFWLTDTSLGNRIAMTKLDGAPFSFDLCRQVYDETNANPSKYDGLNIFYDFCVQDDQTGDFLSIDSFTGVYIFRRQGFHGFTSINTGRIMRGPCIVRLSGLLADVTLDTCRQDPNLSGLGQVKRDILEPIFLLRDRDITDNTCGLNRCGSKSTEFVQRMKDLKAGFENR